MRSSAKRRGSVFLTLVVVSAVILCTVVFYSRKGPVTYNSISDAIKQLHQSEMILLQAQDIEDGRVVLFRTEKLDAVVMGVFRRTQDGKWVLDGDMLWNGTERQDPVGFLRVRKGEVVAPQGNLSGTFAKVDVYFGRINNPAVDWVEIQTEDTAALTHRCPIVDGTFLCVRSATYPRPTYRIRGGQGAKQMFSEEHLPQ